MSQLTRSERPRYISVTIELEPSVTVVIPAWNRAEGALRTVLSVLQQDFDAFEIVVVDDGSTDETPSTVMSIGDSRVRLVQAPHEGVSAARNRGVDMARGEVITFLDCDDEPLPGWLEALTTPLLSRNVDLMVSGWRMLDSDGQTSEWIPSSDRATADDIGPHFLAGSWAIRRDHFLRTGGFDRSISYGECTEMALRLLSADPRPRLGILDRPLHVHRRNVVAAVGVQAQGARVVLTKLSHRRADFPRTWAAYHTLVGVDDSRNGRTRKAVRHLFAALVADPLGGRRLSRLIVAMVPKLARRQWRMEVPRADPSGGPRLGQAQATTTMDAE